MRVLSSMSGPQCGGLTLGRGAPRAFGFEGQWGLVAGVPRDWGKQRLHSYRAHTKSHTHQEQGQKPQFHRSLGQTYLLVLEGLLGREGCLWLTLGTRTLVVDVSGSIYLCELSWRLTYCHQGLAPPKSL